MNFKYTVKNAILQAFDSKRMNNRKLTTSYVSLFLAFLILISGTISWFTFRDTANVDSDTFSLESASGLRVNEGESMSNHVILDKIRLDEASSVDGRNFFFPTTGTFTSATNSSVFREGNVGDKNQKYVYKDFRLRGSSGEGNTEIYVKGYTIEVGNQVFNGSTEIVYVDGKPTETVKHSECPVRIAFIINSQDDPQVIDPTALVSQYTHTYNAVESTDNYGNASVTKSVADPFSMYYYVLGTPLFTLKGTQPIDVTMVVWLEGTENADTGESKSKDYANEEISVDIELESNWTDMEMVTFVDNTLGDNQGLGDINNPQQWIGNDGHIVTMTYTDVTTTDNKGKNPVRTVVMSPVAYKTNGQAIKWEAPIPKAVITDITFNRYDSANEIIYNAWYTKSDAEAMWDKKTDKPYTLQATREIDGVRQLVYTAIRGNGYSTTTNVRERLSSCAGYWGYSKLSGGGSGGGESGGGDSGTLVELGIALDTSAKSWIQTNVNNGYKMYVQLNDGTTKEIPHTGYNRFEIKGSDFKVPSGSIIKTFYLSDGTTKQQLNLVKQVSVTSSYNFTFYINNEDKFEQR
ncbi:MAG: hypothetical protein J1E85_05385 [Ruminococcus sp.]|nr:hypothetical protein [Ruminococcus sp.]